jgi:hypothetical protein
MLRLPEYLYLMPLGTYDFVLQNFFFSNIRVYFVPDD